MFTLNKKYRGPLAAGLYFLLIHSVASAGFDLTTGMALVPSGYYIPVYLEAKPSPTPLSGPSNSKSNLETSVVPKVTRAEDRRVAVDSFFLDIYPVTNIDFLKFVRLETKWQKSKIKKIFADRNYLQNWKSSSSVGDKSLMLSPVTFVSWFAARAYCQSIGKRLPTVAEWERAVNSPDVKKEMILEWYSRPTPSKVGHVGSTFKNAFGVYDMVGLVWEWTEDFNSALVTGESRGDSAIERNLFCGNGAAGASDFSDYAAFMRDAFRSSLKADYTVANLGFRCAIQGPKKKENKK